jgi:hypothetical protein
LSHVNLWSGFQFNVAHSIFYFHIPFLIFLCRVVVRRAVYGLFKTVLQRLHELAAQELGRLAPLVFAAIAEKVRKILSLVTI